MILLLNGWHFKNTIWQYLHLAPQFQQEFQQAPQQEIIHHDYLSDTPIYLSQPTTIIAWSLGGLLALKHLHEYPEQCSYVQKIILISTPQYLSSKNNFQILYNRNMRACLKHFLKLSFKPASSHNFGDIYKTYKTHIHFQPHPKWQEYLETLFLYSDLEQQNAMLENLPSSLHIQHIYGDQDTILKHHPMEHPNMQSHIIEGAGHLPFISHSHIFHQHLEQCLTCSYTTLPI